MGIAPVFSSSITSGKVAPFGCAETLFASTSWMDKVPAALLTVAVEVAAGGVVAPLPMSPSRYACRWVAKLLIAAMLAADAHPARWLSTNW